MPHYTRSELACAYLRLRDKPLSFDDHPYMVGMLDSTHMDKLYMCSRQVGKSVSIGVELLIDPITDGLPISGLREVYVSPREKTSKQFSVEKLSPMIFESAPYVELYIDSTCRRDVFLYTFKSDSGGEGHQIYLRAAYHSADSARGIPADKICFDEVQDIIPAFLPDIESCTIASPYGMILKCGTPKSEDNHIEQMWQKSVQFEWAVLCTHCSKWNCPLGSKHIGKEQVVCEYCGLPLNPVLHGTWVLSKNQDTPGAAEGFHINQLASKQNMTLKYWENNILKNLNNWTEDKFNNEILGISSGRAQKLLTDEDMQRCLCQSTPLFPMDRMYDMPPRKDVEWFGGVDWGEGRDEGSINNGKKHFASYTIFYIATYDMYGKLNIAHWKKFKGPEAAPSFLITYIAKKMQDWNIQMLGVDYGHGWGVIEQLITMLGSNERVVSMYESANLTQLMNYKPTARMYTINRNEFIARMVNSIKRQEINFPKGTEGSFPDFTAEFTEYSEQMRQLMYSHRVNEPDDSLHALMYLKIVADLRRGLISVPQ